MMEWQGVENDCVGQRTIGGERAHRYYYIWEKSVKVAGQKVDVWIAGRYTFGREIDFGRKVFPNSASARAYCEKVDKEAVIIEAVTA